jgi:hypothetical protein
VNLILPQFGLALHCFAKPWLRRKSWSWEQGTLVSFTPGLTECKDCACRTHKVWRMHWENWHKKIGNMFCEQLLLSRYADIYTSRVSNFCRYSPFMYFRSQTQVRTPSCHAICHTIIYFFILMHAQPEPKQILNQASLSFHLFLLAPLYMWSFQVCVLWIAHWSVVMFLDSYIFWRKFLDEI